ncbi:hypothetical protein R6Q59_028746 [Mikania micrantha]|uniref:Dof zinc finger protein n=1 Tax=Mikania micrantha TaxID=192012 RepID=A0A5N6LXC1_9ASTR|nr:hypothetical protein E3N88_39640 [Mikania micrantha]
MSTYSSQMNTSLQFPEHEHLNCPRCDSNNTKFCYYNNYNLLQPRHYCKNCRRYWTKGGTLRKVPIGGGTRKSTKRSSTSNKRPDDSLPPSSTPTVIPPPPVQLKPESSVVFDFDNNPSKIIGGGFNSSNHRARFGGFLDILTPNLTVGSENDGLKKTAETGVFQVNNSSMSNDGSNQRGCDGGGNGWPEFSIFRSGSNFR